MEAQPASINAYSGRRSMMNEMGQSISSELEDFLLPVNLEDE